MRKRKTNLETSQQNELNIKFYSERKSFIQLSGNLDANSVDIEKRAVQTLYSQPYAIYEDEGWYRCVAKNEMGVVYEDTFLSIASPQGTRFVEWFVYNFFDIMMNISRLGKNLQRRKI